MKQMRLPLLSATIRSTRSSKLLGGNIPDQLSLGGYRWFEVALYWVLRIGSLAVAYTNWRMDATQRTGTHLMHLRHAARQRLYVAYSARYGSCRYRCQRASSIGWGIQ